MEFILNTWQALKLGGVAPHGYTLYLNVFFTLLFLAQLAVRFQRSD
jgi:hypothetical protein